MKTSQETFQVYPLTSKCMILAQNVFWSQGFGGGSEVAVYDLRAHQLQDGSVSTPASPLPSGIRLPAIPQQQRQAPQSQNIQIQVDKKIWIYLCLSIYGSICLSVYFYLSVCLFLSIFLSACLSIFLSVCLSNIHLSL